MKITSIMCGISIYALLSCARPVLAQAEQQKSFASPEEAVVELVEATQANDLIALNAIFGLDAKRLLDSGDPIMDQQNREAFLAAYAENAVLMMPDDARRTLFIGYEVWPFPIPLVKEHQSWRFDTAAGVQEILFRRIGRNELSTIRVCQAYVDAQHEYASSAHDQIPAGAYAQKIASTPGKQDGLYWKSEDPDQLSPLGELAADAAADGYHSDAKPGAFHGYIFRILRAESSSGTRRARSYIDHGQMRGGFALIAQPAEYEISGVMTFIVNQDGVVYQKDLGPKTLAMAAGIQQFSADSTWKKVE
jgi:Protein of unknown function (DUF2950)